MGVKDLWTLLGACGERVSLKSMCGNVLAIDASLWLVQFVKAMRDGDGNVRVDAHLVGLIRRIAKLLFARVRPVFVFDGPAPALKRKTLAKRRQIRDRSKNALQRAAEKLLLTHLQAQNIHDLRRKLRDAANKEHGSEIGPSKTTVANSADKDEANSVSDGSDSDLFGSDSDEKVEDEPPSPSSSSGHTSDDANENGPLELPADLDALDAVAVASLPFSLQYEILERKRYDGGHGSRQKLIQASKSSLPDAFSNEQLDQFLKNADFKAEVKSIREEMNVSGHTNGTAIHRIASAPDRAYYFETNDRGLLGPQRSLHTAKRRRTGRGDGNEYSLKRKLEQYQMLDWTCLSCNSGNLAIRNHCEKCHKLRKDSSSRCNAAVSSTNTTMIDRSAEFESFLDEELNIDEDANSRAGLESPVVSTENTRNDVAVPSPSLPSPTPAATPAISGLEEEQVLSLHNSRLNFYRLSARSKPHSSRVQELIRESQEQQEERLTISPPSDSVSPVRTPGQPCDTSSLRAPRHLSSSQVPDAGTSLEEEIDTNALRGTVTIMARFVESAGHEDDSDGVFLSVSRTDAGLPLDAKPDSADKRSRSIDSDSQSDGVEQTPTALTAFNNEADLQQEEIGGGFMQNDEKEETGREANNSSQNATEFLGPNRDADELLIHRELEDSDGDADAAGTQAPVDGDGNGYFPSEDFKLNEAQQKLSAAQAKVREVKKKHQRDAETISDTMIEDTKHLLRIFGIPFIVAPAEAEAQCAALEQLGLVDGVVTDDSDVFLFGARKVYKNMFNQNRFVEMYKMETFERELGVDRDKLIEMALLLGSDYTEGVHGIGIVNALEIVNAFQDLAEFRDWVYSSEVTKKPADTESSSSIVRLETFKWHHRNIRRSWSVPRSFPSAEVTHSYLHPRVEKNAERFSWADIDIPALKQFCGTKMNWSESKVDDLLRPIQKVAAEPVYQSRLEQHFSSRAPRAATIRSTRLLAAVQGLTEARSASKLDKEYSRGQ